MNPGTSETKRISKLSNRIERKKKKIQMKFDTTTAVNNSMTMCLVLLLLGATTTLCRYGVVPVDGHFIWADTDYTNEGNNYQDVGVEFSEQAGIRDPLARMLPPGMTMEYYGIGAATHEHSQEDHVPLTLSKDRSYLTGLLPRHAKYNTGSAYVYGTLDYGKFEDFNDLFYPFATQIYGFNSEADYETFFRPLLKTITTPTIAMKNCGGSNGKTESYKFDIGGFPSEGTVNVCIYQQGGLKLGCGDFVPTTTTTAREETILTSVDRRRRRQLRQYPHEHGSTKSLVLSIDSIMHDQQQQQQQQQGSTTISSSSSSPLLLYALANSTTTDEASGKQNIIFASTSVYFEGRCTTKM